MLANSVDVSRRKAKRNSFDLFMVSKLKNPHTSEIIVIIPAAYCSHLARDLLFAESFQRRRRWRSQMMRCFSHLRDDERRVFHCESRLRSSHGSWRWYPQIDGGRASSQFLILRISEVRNDEISFTQLSVPGGFSLLFSLCHCPPLMESFGLRTEGKRKGIVLSWRPIPLCYHFSKGFLFFNLGASLNVVLRSLCVCRELSVIFRMGDNLIISYIHTRASPASRPLVTDDGREARIGRCCWMFCHVRFLDDLERSEQSSYREPSDWLWW